MKKYKLLKCIELRDSLPLGYILELGVYYTLCNGEKIPTERLVAQGYLEEVPEWIDKAYKQSTTMPRDPNEYDPEMAIFIRAVSSNMPKQEQQKFDEKEIADFSQKHWDKFNDQLTCRISIRNFLGSKGLLKE